MRASFIITALAVSMLAPLAFAAPQEPTPPPAAQPATPVYGKFLRQIENVWPAAVSVDNDHHILIEDTLGNGYGHSLRLFDRDGNELKLALTGSVSRTEQLQRRLREITLPPDARFPLEPKLVDLAADNASHLFVVDAANHRVVCLDAGNENAVLWSLGGFGSNPGQFNDPAAIAWVPGTNTLLVADAQNHRIQAISTSGEFLYEWGKHAMVPRQGEGRIHYPNDVAVSPDGSFVVVAELFERRVQIFGVRDGDPLNETPASSRLDVQSHFGRVMAVDGRLCAITEPELRRVLVFDMGRPVPIHITSFGSYGTKLGQFANIAGLAIDEASKTIYVLDAGTQRMDVVELNFDPAAPPKFDATMAKFVRSVPLHALVMNDHATLDGLTVSRDGEFIITDRTADQLLVRSASNDEWTPWQPANAAGERMQLIAASVDPTFTRALVIDEQSRSVDVFKPGWRHLMSLHALGEDGDKLIFPVAACFAEAGVFIVDAGGDRIVQFDHDGQFVRAFGKSGTGDGELWLPAAVGIDCQGRVVVLDYGNHRGQLFSADGQWLASFSAGRARTRAMPPAKPSSPPPAD